MIINLLPQLLAERGVSIRQLSRDTGVTYSTIWAMVHGQRRSVQLEVLDAVCVALGVQPGDIYGRATAEARPAVAREKAQLARQEEAARPRPDRGIRKNISGEWRTW